MVKQQKTRRCSRGSHTLKQHSMYTLFLITDTVNLTDSMEFSNSIINHFKYNLYAIQFQTCTYGYKIHQIKLVN